MSEAERRSAERLLLRVPIRVLAFGAIGAGFTEDSYTVEVNRAGARIALKHRVAAGDSLRIINLENFCEADFQVLGPTRLDSGDVAEWGVDCLEEGRNIWGIDFPPPIAPAEPQAGALLQCQGCGKQVLSVLRLMEVDVLNAVGRLQQSCDQCGQTSSWAYADAARRPQPSPPPVAGAAHGPPEPPKGPVERRAHKRLPLKLTVLIRNRSAEKEISKTENISKGGMAVSLGMKLAVGDMVTAVCPYTEGGQNLEQKAEVRRRVAVAAGTRWLYGLRYVS